MSGRSESNDSNRDPGDQITSLLYSDPDHWQMSASERFALDGLLKSLRPKIAIEVGVATGGSLATIARHSTRVIGIDPVPSAASACAGLPNAEVITGLSQTVLPTLLAEIAGRGDRVEFLLIDGDHAEDAVYEDARITFQSRACEGALVMFHDSFYPPTRRGIERACADCASKLAWFDLDFITGARFDSRTIQGPWRGLALARISDGGKAANRTHAPSLFDLYTDFDGRLAVEASKLAQAYINGTALLPVEASRIAETHINGTTLLRMAIHKLARKLTRLFRRADS